MPKQDFSWSYDRPTYTADHLARFPDLHFVPEWCPCGSPKRLWSLSSGWHVNKHLQSCSTWLRQQPKRKAAYLKNEDYVPPNKQPKICFNSPPPKKDAQPATTTTSARTSPKDRSTTRRPMGTSCFRLSTID